MKNSSERLCELCKILKAIGKFVEKEHSSFSRNDKVKKSGELLEGFQDTIEINGTPLVILQLPEGVIGVIDPWGRLYDYDILSKEVKEKC